MNFLFAQYLNSHRLDFNSELFDWFSIIIHQCCCITWDHTQIRLRVLLLLPLLLLPTGNELLHILAYCLQRLPSTLTLTTTTTSTATYGLRATPPSSPLPAAAPQHSNSNYYCYFTVIDTTITILWKRRKKNHHFLISRPLFLHLFLGLA